MIFLNIWTVSFLSLWIRIQGFQNVELVEDQDNSISCKHEGLLDSCLWSFGSFECNATRGEIKTCGSFKVDLETENDVCTLTFEEGISMEDMGNYTCVLSQGGQSHEGM